MKSVSLNAYPRTSAGRNAVVSLRRNGRIPAVIYGRQTQPQQLEIVTSDLEGMMKSHHSENVLVDLMVAQDARPQRLALIQEVQHHPMSRKVLHVDLHEVAADEPVTISVPVESTGEPLGVKNSGGVLEHVLYRIKVRALPKDLPEEIVVDVSSLEMNRAIHIGDIVAPPSVEILGHKELVVFACAAPKAEVEAAPEEGVAPAAVGEVEMIKEKKEEGEGEKTATEGDKKKAAPGDAEKKKPAEADKKK
jgi:large subunit ribosomal protein L25